MRISHLLAAAALAAFGAGSLSAAAQDPPPATTQYLPPEPRERPAMDPEAMAALDRMGAYLRTLTSFEVRTETTIDEVSIDDDQKLQFAGSGLYRVRRPNAFFVEQRTDRRHRQFFYDGSTFTVYAPRMHYYAQVSAPGTIAETVTMAEDNYNINLPLADLFYWGTPEDERENITRAQHIGFARINNQDADHYAFQQGDIDWQIWIQRGDRPLPLKAVFTTRNVEQQPQYSSVLTWDLNPRFENTTFVFTPDTESRRIQIASAEE